MNFFAGGKRRVTENDFYRSYGMGNCVERSAHWKRFYHCDNNYDLGNIVGGGKSSGDCRGNGYGKCCDRRVEGHTLH